MQFKCIVYKNLTFGFGSDKLMFTDFFSYLHHPICKSFCPLSFTPFYYLFSFVLSLSLFMFPHISNKVPVLPVIWKVMYHTCPSNFILVYPYIFVLCSFSSHLSSCFSKRGMVWDTYLQIYSILYTLAAD